LRPLIHIWGSSDPTARAFLFLVSVIGVRLIRKQVQLVGDFIGFGCGPGFEECLGHRHFFEEGDRENLEQSVEGGIEGEALLNDGDQDVDGNRDPYLRPNRVVQCAVELFDPQMLLDPFEKQFDLPAAFIEGANRRPAGQIGWSGKRALYPIRHP
jgi:hypothetical protein